MTALLDTKGPLDPLITECPFDYYDELRRSGGVFKVPGRNFYLVGRYDLVMQVVKKTRTFLFNIGSTGAKCGRWKSSSEAGGGANVTHGRPAGSPPISKSG